MNKILEFNREEKYLLVQPGVFLKEIQELVEKESLFYPPDPTERNSFIGGNVATNASGARTFKYGATRNYVKELKIILPNGETLQLKRGRNFANGNLLKLTTEEGNTKKIFLPKVYVPRTSKNAAGYFIKEGMDAIDLFIGAEGTLGIITEIKLQLIQLPQNILSAVVFFDDVENALDFIDLVRTYSYDSRAGKEKRIDARGIEFFDERALNFLWEDYPKIPTGSKAAVWFEQELTEENENDVSSAWFELIEKFKGDVENSWFAIDAKDREKFKDFRHAVSSKVADYISAKNLRKVGTDTAVEDSKFKEYYYYSVRLAEESGIDFIVYGHAGNSHLHLNFLPKGNEEFLKAKFLYKQLCQKAIEFNGTISAEHGIGKIKSEYFLMMFGEKAVKEIAGVKKGLDPNLILNIGNIIEEKFLRD